MMKDSTGEYRGGAGIWSPEKASHGLVFPQRARMSAGTMVGERFEKRGKLERNEIENKVQMGWITLTGIRRKGGEGPSTHGREIPALKQKGSLEGEDGANQYRGGGGDEWGKAKALKSSCLSHKKRRYHSL